MSIATGLSLLTLIAYAICGSMIYICCKRLQQIPSVYKTYYRYWLWWTILAILICLGLHQVELQLPPFEKLLRFVLKQGTLEAIAIGAIIVLLLIENKWQRFPGLKWGLGLLMTSVGIQLGLRYIPEITGQYPRVIWIGSVSELAALGIIGWVTTKLIQEFMELRQKSRRKRSEGNSSPQAVDEKTDEINETMGERSSVASQE